MSYQAELHEAKANAKGGKANAKGSKAKGSKANGDQAKGKARGAKDSSAFPKHGEHATMGDLHCTYASKTSYI